MSPLFLSFKKIAMYKRKAFASVITVISFLIMFGWVWIPDSVMYKTPRVEANYTLFAYIWGNAACIIMLSFALIKSYEFGLNLFDYLKK